MCCCVRYNRPDSWTNDDFRRRVHGLLTDCKEPLAAEHYSQTSPLWSVQRTSLLKSCRLFRCNFANLSRAAVFFWLCAGNPSKQAFSTGLYWTLAFSMLTEACGVWYRALGVFDWQLSWMFFTFLEITLWILIADVCRPANWQNFCFFGGAHSCWRSVHQVLLTHSQG